MNTIGFIGAYDKTDFIMYIAKIITAMDKKVIVIDTTVNQKAKYIIPAIIPTTSYVTEFEGIDVAVGLFSYKEIEDYLGISTFEACGYDYVLVDVDNPEMLEEFNIYNANKNFFVTSFDLFSLKRGVEVLSGIKLPMQLTKVLFSTKMSKEEDDYLNYLSLGMKIEWLEERVYFPYDNGDQTTIIENQRMAKLKIRSLSNEYKEALIYLIIHITNDSDNNIRKLVKQLEKEG